MKKILLNITFGLIITTLNAQQDRHYSMFYASPMTMNPASTGFFQGDIQLFTNYRNQWSSINPSLFKTISASVDTRLFEDAMDGNFVGAGLNIYNDVAGDSKLTTNVYNLSFSYALEISQDQKLSFGVQPSLLQRSIKNSDLSWDNQWTGAEFNTSISNNESIFAGKSTEFDLNAGVYYYGRPNDDLLLNFGLAGSHILSPENSLLNSDEKLYRKITIHGGAEISTRSNLVIVPNFYLFQQGPNSSLALGSDFRYILKESSRYTGYNDETSISLGAYYRLKDALYTTFFVNWNSLSFGASYDINLSSFSVATGGVGAFEFLLRYRIKTGKSGVSSL